jgi:predicted O-methyltransferase YrrM
LYSIDHHTGSKEHKKGNKKIFTLPKFTENIRRYNVGHVIDTIITTSIEASKIVNSKITLIFIDGSHEYEDVKNDFNLWWQKLEIGGIIMFHDTLTKIGVSKLIDEIISQRDDIGTPKLLHEITYFQKTINAQENINKNKFFIEQKKKAKKQLEILKKLKK